jgi:tetratricopeptide (TPR) repeat protein
MNALKISIIFLVLAFALTCVREPANAGVWDDPKNLKVLPEDISPGELRATMMSFIKATGSRCSNCHVAIENGDTRTMDFPLDDKENKRTARKMITMVRNINDYLTDNLGTDSTDHVTVECATCHRGVAKPEMIQDVMTAVFYDGGLEEAIAEYRILRDKYFGAYAFDFSANGLNDLSERMAGADELDAALTFLDLNLEFNPESVRAYQLQGDMWKKKDDVAAARKSYEKALEMAPDNAFTQSLLEKLNAPDT